MLGRLGYTFDPAVDTVNADAYVPDAYATQLETAAPGIGAMIQQSAAPGEGWTDTLRKLLPTIAATYQQKQLLDVQVDRAKAGLPPLDVSQYAAGVNVGLSPEVMKTIVMIAIGLGAVLLIGSRRA